jgi:hypothetical protein
MHMRKSLFVLVISLLALALPLQGQTPRKGLGPAGSKGTVGAPILSPEYGIVDWSVTSTWAGGMAVAYNETAVFKHNNGNGYYYMSAGGDAMAGQISIPSGVDIGYIGFENCDTVGSDYTMWLWDNEILVDTFDSSAKFGCDWEYHPGLPALNYAYDKNQTHTLMIYIYQGNSAPTNGIDGVRGVNVFWKRKVSPAPVTQTFNDVAPADFGYQYIEALFAAGITGGCGGGNYCPNGTLTRAQMAVFISKALGLYWPR